MEDRDRFDALTWWDTYGGMGLLPKFAKKVLSQVINTSSAERCWSTYSFIHNVRRNRLNENRAESLVYVHYNLRLLSHYCDRAYEDLSYKVWDNNPEDDNLEDDTIHLEELEAELLRDEDEGMPCHTHHPVVVPVLVFEFRLLFLCYLQLHPHMQGMGLLVMVMVLLGRRLLEDHHYHELLIN